MNKTYIKTKRKQTSLTIFVSLKFLIITPIISYFFSESATELMSLSPAVNGIDWRNDNDSGGLSAALSQSMPFTPDDSDTFFRNELDDIWRLLSSTLDNDNEKYPSKNLNIRYLTY